MLLSATDAETVPPGVRVCRPCVFDGGVAASTNGGNLQLGETTSYVFVVASHSGCRVKGKGIFRYRQAFVRLVVTFPQYKQLELHHVFNLRVWAILIVA